MTNLFAKSFGIFMITVSALAFTACEDDNNVDNPVAPVESEATIDLYDQCFNIDVKLDGAWKAEVVYDDPEELTWIALNQTEGKGHATVTANVPANTDEKLRRAKVIFTAENGKQVVTVKQTSLIEWMAAQDNNANVDASLFGDKLPLGCGIKIAPNTAGYTMSAGQIFTVDQWVVKDAHGNIEYIDPDLRIREDDAAVTKIEFQNALNAEKAVMDVKANLSVDVSYMMFKLKLNGAFNLYGSTSGNVTTYSIYAPKRVKNYFFDPFSAEFAYEMADEDVQRKILSPSFVRLRDMIYSAKNDATKFNKYMSQLDKVYGPVFCTGVEVGGSVNVQSIFEAKSSNDTLQIKGMLDVGFNSLFSIDVKASAEYLNTMFNDMKSYSMSLYLKGGSTSATNALVNGLADLMAPAYPGNANSNAFDMTANNQKILKLINDWAASIDATKLETITCTDYALEPVWSLFDDDPEVQRMMKEWFKAKYPNVIKDGVETCPYAVNIQALANE